MITLVPFDSVHLDKVREWANDRELSLLMNRILPVSDVEHAAWHQKLVHDRTKTVFIIAADGKPIGICSLTNINADGRSRKAELMICIGEVGYRGKGHGFTVCQKLLDFGFLQLNLNRIYLYVVAYNAAALRVYEKVGFVREGESRQDVYLNGQYHNTVWMGILREEWLSRKGEA